MKSNPERIPVIVGVADIKQRSIEKLSDALEPLDLLVQVISEALIDAGGGLRGADIDAFRVVRQLSWSYRDLAGNLSQRMGSPLARTFNGPVGGESPLRLLVDAASDIAAGRHRVSVVCGAEALRSRALYGAAGISPPWSDLDPQARLPEAEDFVSELAARYGLAMPVDVYPLYENALRAHWGQSFEESQHESGQIGSAMSRVAAANPASWSGKHMEAAAVVTPSVDNRSVCFPYQKFMVANLAVNQGAAVVMTSLAHARELGISDDQLVYVWGGAGAHEPKDFLARDRFDHAPGMAAVLRHTLARHGLSSTDVNLHELYSCFPCVPKMARRILNLSADAVLTQAGGLTFFGGPGNNYMTHGVTAMVRAMRAGAGDCGLLYGNGEYVTKHHAAILARTPPPIGVRVCNDDLQAEVEREYGPVPLLLDEYVGPAKIETFQVAFDPKGQPDRGTVIARTPEGQRVVARVTEAEPEILAWLVSGSDEPVGRNGVVYAHTDGWLHFAFAQPKVLPEPVVTFEMHGEHVAVITLNREKQRNAINGDVARLLAQYVDRVDRDPAIRVAILTGAGSAAFCAGADLSSAGGHRANEVVVGRKHFAGFVNAKRLKPWIAAVRGLALGGGTELALACDLVVAGQSATFGLPEVQRSLIAAAGGLYRLPRTVPQRAAMELILTGDCISAARALELYLVNQVVADDGVLDAALAMASRVAAAAPKAVQESVLIARRSLEQDDQLLVDGGVAIGRVLATEDFREGMAAFMQKRKPVWKGK